jgi:hypothetical protein
VTSDGDLRAVVLVRTARSRRDLVRVLGAMVGVLRVELLQGPYDLVIHAAGAAQVEAIERFPGVTAAEVCWLSRAQGGCS